MSNSVYHIYEIFYSIQGEGLHTGLPAIFVRFAGCNLSCSFCDEPANHAKGQPYSFEAIVQSISQYPCKTIILTGGEPLLQVDTDLIQGLKEQGYRLHVETNGTQPIPQGLDWVTISPKNNSYEKGDELKVIYQGQSLDRYDYSGFKYHYIQPVSHSNIDACIQVVLKNPSWRLSLQVHRWLNIK